MVFICKTLQFCHFQAFLYCKKIKITTTKVIKNLQLINSFAGIFFINEDFFFRCGLLQPIDCRLNYRQSTILDTFQVCQKHIEF
jgi:hypothetical protein